MKINYLSVEDILRLHFQIIEDFGGSHGVRDEGRLLSVVQVPKLNVFGKEQYRSVFEKAAVYLRNTIGDHPFIDGYKRTAVTICAIFLKRNKKLLTVTPKDLENFTVKVAVNNLEIKEIAAWLKNNTD
jgi:death on curing protein